MVHVRIYVLVSLALLTAACDRATVSATDPPAPTRPQTVESSIAPTPTPDPKEPVNRWVT
ncbi:MAG: hypothetical protein QOK47_1254, partial [Actinomycetota bacterium]|nr:hypothetical protein [Actinomycetota bacterium]